MTNEAWDTLREDIEGVAAGKVKKAEHQWADDAIIEVYAVGSMVRVDITMNRESLKPLSLKRGMMMEEYREE